jgi:hypothetical protein
VLWPAGPALPPAGQGRPPASVLSHPPLRFTRPLPNPPPSIPPPSPPPPPSQVNLPDDRVIVVSGFLDDPGRPTGKPAPSIDIFDYKTKS